MGYTIGIKWTKEKVHKEALKYKRRIDFQKNFAWTLLTNRVHPSRHKESKIHSLRIKVGDAIIREFGCK